MTLREALASAFVVTEAEGGALLLRPRDGSGRAMVLDGAARAALETRSATAVADVLRAIGEARGREHVLVLHGGRITPSTDPDSVVRDTAPEAPAPTSGTWVPYD
ncbi:hypothetical protein GRS96_18750 [Rathayibacter sp. VKM Ac-2803]|uniref:hypothetical protein n=1 Tax=Rathayibacter sp. VKM Ac-2803 TaxID=2609256 RepID=UPI00135951CC|nr:hypothetical protein [Rathayibacter sp. VKM Ac-2803]MWV51314.1 hypothetical protein [Rathayibacter sp. VKM Ac-2803]